MFASLLVHFSFDVLIAISVMELYEGETFPVAKRYYTSAEAYRFIESSPRSMNKNFPSAAAGGWFSRCKRMRRKTYLDTFNNDTPIISVDGSDHISKLPDDILLQLFRYLHPLDYVHSLSLVCKRWNLLVQFKGLWKDVRVIADERSVKTGALRRFLTKMNDGIKRLCIGYTKCKQIPPLLPEALPESMNTVTVLDIGDFSGITIGLWEKLISCFTNVEVLNLAGTYMVTEDGKDSALVKIFFGENAFRKIRHFICGIATAIPDDGTGDLFLSALWQWNRPLELLSFSDEIDLCSDISKAPFAASLTVLHLRGPQDKDDFLIISGLINLKELFVEEVIADDKILVETKKLSNLVHLHFKSFREKGCFSDSGFANLFELPEVGGKNRFPSKLKYLKLEGCCGFNERAADALARNCPALESLNIRGINSMGENAVLKIIRGIRELRFLNLSRFDDESQRSAIRSLEDGYLPHLKFLRIHYTKVPEETLRKLLLKRKDLLINTRQGHVLTFTVRNGNPQFDEQFTGNQELLENDLLGQPGYCCLKY